MRNIFIVLTILALPIVAQAQTALEAEIRAAITVAAQEQGLSAEEVTELVRALSKEAEEQQIGASDVAAAQAAFQAESYTDDMPVTSVPLISPPVLSLTLILLAGLVLWLWKKMRHGGALGPVESA